jgi:hypothetical protein
MGNTTLIELNHDRYGDIEADKGEWIELILQHMRLHAFSDEVSIPGGRIVATFHRGDTRISDAWDRFKTRWMKGIYR